MTSGNTRFRRALAAAAVLATATVGGTLVAQTAVNTTDDADTGPKITTTDPRAVTPGGPPPPWAPNIDPQMLAIIEELGAAEAPPLPELSAFQVRNTPSPTDAVHSLLKKTGIPATAPEVDISHRVLPVGAVEGTLVRIYTPRSTGTSMPAIVYFHGGGWVIADLDTYEPSAKALAARTGSVVISVAYRQAPEHRYPTAHEDSFAAYRYIAENAPALGVDGNRVAVAGESAGGNLAVSVAIMARDRGAVLPVHILSVYPIASGRTDSSSYVKYENARPLSKAAMNWFFRHYVDDAKNAPFVNLLSADLTGLPPTTIINAEIDPLASEGEALASQLREAGVDVQNRTYAGVTHEFFGMAVILDQAADAQGFAAQRLRDALGKPSGR